MHFGLWITTVSSICAATIFALIGALSAIVNTTVTPVEPIAGRMGLLIWNCISCKICNKFHLFIVHVKLIRFVIVLFAGTAVTAWTIQFYKKLVYNVLIQEDLDNHWTTEGRAAVGYSFWYLLKHSNEMRILYLVSFRFVVGSLLSHICNIFLLTIIDMSERRKSIKQSPSAEKTNSAVLLY